MSDDQLQGSHFYAVIETGRLECPRCGLILLFGYGGSHPDDRHWNPIASRLTCPRCLYVYTIGMIAWPVARGNTTMGSPADQVASIRQLAEIRQRAGGFWVNSRKAPEGALCKEEEGRKVPRNRPRVSRIVTDPVNRYVPEGCCCAPLPWRAECAVHGQIGRDREIESKPKGESE